MFYISNTGEQNCELRLKRALDYEAQQSYSMTVKLKSLANIISQDSTTAKVTNLPFISSLEPF